MVSCDKYIILNYFDCVSSLLYRNKRIKELSHYFCCLDFVFDKFQFCIQFYYLRYKFQYCLILFLNKIFTLISNISM